MSATTLAPNPARVRQLNDLFRSTFVGGAVFVTPAIEALDNDSKRRLLADVRAFDAFNDGNDPHQEHDFGTLELNGQRFMWKIGYMDKATCTRASEDPSDSTVTTRVLTVCRADED